MLPPPQHPLHPLHDIEYADPPQHPPPSQLYRAPPEHPLHPLQLLPWSRSRSAPLNWGASGAVVSAAIITMLYMLVTRGRVSKYRLCEAYSARITGAG